ncbi:MAG: hypothetical protein EON98_04725 [Chitinophagaceae bacterium]|nr:MAG: hypothetical protein EON98_04725 [Chitinophagaceae bacterium]
MKKLLLLACSFACLQLAAQNVGIGTTTPTHQLDVNGNLRVRGLSNTSGQATSFMQVDADGVLRLAKIDTLRANPTPVAAGNAGTGNGTASDYPSAIAVSGTKACVVNATSYTIDLFDVSGANPILLGSATTNNSGFVAVPSDVTIQETKAYVITQASAFSSLQTFDISGNTPVRLSTMPIGDDGWRLVIRNGKAYITTANNILSVYDLSGSTPTLVGSVATGGAPRDFLLIGNKAYVLNSSSNALQVFDITANTPVYVTTVGTDVQPYGITTDGLRLYVANRNAMSIEVFDIAGNAPVSISRTPIGILPEKIKMDGSRAYVVGNSNLLNVFDASGRLKPVLIGNVPFLNTASTAKALALSDRKAYVGTTDKKLQVFALGFSGGITAIGPDGNLVVVPDASLGGDNLGDHNVKQNLNLRNFQLVGNDGTSGLGISATGNVGIGAATPHAPLQFSNVPLARKLVLSENADNDHNFFGFGTDASALRYQVSNTAASHVFSAATSSAASKELMRITGNGRVGIGTNAPGSVGNTSSRVEIASEDGGNSDLQLRLAGDGYPGIFLCKSGGTFASPTAVSGGEIISTLQAGYYTGTTYQPSAGINFLSAGTPNGYGPGVIQLYTRGNDGSFGNNTIFMNELGSVGIGNNAPKHRLDVAGNVRIADSLGIGIDRPLAPLQLANTLSNRKIVLYSDGTNPHQFYGFGVTPNELRYQSTANHVFYSALSAISSRELFRVNANGRLGVGVSTPSCLLANTTDNIVGGTNVGLGAGSVAWQMNEAGYVQGLYNASTATYANGLLVKIAGTTANHNLLDLSTGSGQGSAGTSIMLVRADGKVGIGTASPSQALSVVGNITATGTITSSSDIRYKTAIEPLSNVLLSVKKLQPIYYHWKVNKFPAMHFGNERQLGFSAQEVERLFPEIVQTDAQGYKSVDYGRLTPVLVQAIKEQQARLDEQEKTLRILVEEMKALKEAIQKR